jgi:hypothetical protein
MKATQQRRWEKQRSYAPFALACITAAALVVAEMANERDESEAGAYVRDTADAWNGRPRAGFACPGSGWPGASGSRAITYGSSRPPTRAPRHPIKEAE